MSNKSNTSYCFQFTAEQLRNNTIATVTLHLVATIACILVIAYILVSKQHRAFTYRLILYLMIISSAWSVSVMFEMVPVHHNDKQNIVEVRQGWEGMCTALGYITQLLETAKLLVVCWIVLYLLFVVVFKQHAINAPFYETCGLLVVFAVPFALDWLPFTWNKYGLSGFYCWIMLTDENDCSQGHAAGIGLIFGVQYAPILAATIFSVISFVVIIVTLCRKASRSELSLVNTYQRGLRKVLGILVYPLIYLLIFAFTLIHRIVYFVEITRKQQPLYEVWIAHTIAVGLGAILVPLVFMLHPQILQKVFCNRCSSKTDEVLFRSTSHTSNARDSILESSGNSSTMYKSILAQSGIQSN